MLSVLGMNTALAETVSPYTVDFEKSITTSSPDFAVASNWGHIVDSWEDYYSGNTSYVSYRSVSGVGVEESQALQVLSNQKSNRVYDLLVTPVVSGTVTIYAKPTGKYYNDVAFVEFYSLNEAGTQRNELLASTNFAEKSNSEEWEYTALTITLDSPQRIGIRGTYVYLDNFSATSAEIVPQTSLKVTAVMNSDEQTGATGTNPVFSQKEDGKTTVSLKVRIENTGDVDLAAGTTANYTLTLAQGNSSSATTYFEDAPFEISVDLPAGENTVLDTEFDVPATTGYTYFYIRENVTGTTSTSNRYCRVLDYASMFIFDKAGTTYNSSSSSTKTPISFGKITEDKTLEYEIYNSGTAPLTINSITVPEPFTSNAPTGEFTVNAGEKKVIAITLPASTPGVSVGNLEIAYTNYGKEQSTYSLAISGTVTDPSKSWITFSNDDNTNGKFPEGSIHPDQVYIPSNAGGSDANYYLQSTSGNAKFVTPLLTAAAGESFTFDAWYTTYYGDAYVKVYTSKDRMEWKQVQQIGASDLGSNPKTFTATIEEAGDYYIAFELNRAMLDDIYGLTPTATPAHDWYVMDSNLPTTGTQNQTYTATIDVKNISANADAIETATLYVNGEAVAVEENVALAANDMTAVEGTGRPVGGSYSNIADPVQISLDFKPHTTGELPAFIELKTGDNIVKTEEVTIVIAEEELSNELTIEGTMNRNGGPVYTWDKNSEIVSLYTAEVLQNNYGLKDGDVISSVAFKGFKTADAHTTSLDVWYEWTDDAEQAKPKDGLYNCSSLTNAISEEEHIWPKEGASDDLKDFIVLNFDNLTYQEGKALRVVARVYSDTYKEIQWETSDITGLSFKHSNDNRSTFEGNSWNGQTLPVIHINLVVEPKTFSGIVIDDLTGEPIENATVTIVNEENDVEYTATTDSRGAYSINVIQSELPYTATIEAEGYLTIAISDPYTFESSKEQNFAMTPDVPIVGSIGVTISDSEYATLYYEGLTLTIPEELKAYTAKVNGKNIDLTEVKDIIPPGTPVIINGPQGDYRFPIGAPISTEMNSDPIFWKVNANTSVTAGTKYVDNEDLTVETVFEGTMSGNKQTINGEEFTHYFQLRVKDWPTAEVPTGTDNGGSTPLVITAKKDAELTVYFRRQKGKEGYDVNDNKDIRLYNQSDISVLDGDLTIDYMNDAGDYGWGYKVYQIEKGQTYTLCAKGTTVNFYGFSYVATAEPEVLDNDLVGTEDELSIADDAANKYYVLSWKDAQKNPEELGFYFWKNSNDGHSMQLGAHKAYLKIPATTGSNKGYVFNLVDAIEHVTVNALTDADAIYTLSGIRVNANNLKKGIYIVNGKKVVIK